MQKKKGQQGFIATVKIGPKGQIVIPKEARDMFDLEPGDSLLLMADPRRGIALQRTSVMAKIAEAILGGNGQGIYPEESEENKEQFAKLVRKAAEDEE